MAHTNGKIFLLDNSPYIGIYHKGPDNNYYTGDSYIFGISRELTLMKIENAGHRIGDENYDALESKFSEKDINYAKDYYPKINKNNLKCGFVLRYFVQQWNDINSRIIEIDPKQSGNIDDGFYKMVELKWLITGSITDVAQHNFDEINEASNEMPKISTKLNNTIELYNLQYSDII